MCSLHLHFVVHTGTAFTADLDQVMIDWLKLNAKVSLLWIIEYVAFKNCLMFGYGASYHVFLFLFYLLVFYYKMSGKVTRVTTKFFFKAAQVKSGSSGNRQASFSPSDPSSPLSFFPSSLPPSLLSSLPSFFLGEALGKVLSVWKGADFLLH